MLQIVKVIEIVEEIEVLQMVVAIVEIVVVLLAESDVAQHVVQPELIIQLEVIQVR